MYTKAMETEHYISSTALLKRAISYIDCLNNDKGLEDLENVLI